MEGILKYENGRLFLKVGKNTYPLNIQLERKYNFEENDEIDVYDDEYEIANGNVVWIKIDERKYYNQRNEKENNRGREKYYPKAQNDNTKSFGYARSPYNFTPLNKQIIADKSKTYFDSFNSERHTGYINITIENKTPIFIGGNGQEFFKVKDKDAIPGSSIRGLIRMMLEIISHGKFVNFDDTKYFMRFIADSSDRPYKIHYYEKMGLSQPGEDYKPHNAKAGFLFYNRADDSYAIYPCTGDVKSFEPENEKQFIHEHNKVEQGWNVFSGNMKYKIEVGGKEVEKNKKQWFIPEIYSKDSLPVSQQIIKEYINDKTRKIKTLDLLKLARWEVGVEEKYKVGVPVFYCQEGNNITSIGHTKNYRIPYENNTSKLVVQNDTAEHTDFAESIFGRSESNDINGINSDGISGRVFFEDAFINNLNGTYLHKMPMVLGSPNPTSFQLYLDQKSKNKKSYDVPKDQLVFWDTEGAEIRGYKLYWHRVTTANEKYLWYNKTIDVSNPDNYKFYKLGKPIKAISEGNVFTGRIRFENLSDIELGALLTAIDLPLDCCHKIGMGKPLGLGTVRITPTLVVSDRPERYASIFDENGNWHAPSKTGMTKEDYKNIFAAFLLTNTDNTKKKKDIWEIERLTQLKAMLEFDAVKMAGEEWLEKTRYMTIQPKEFQKRDVLPNPKEVKDL